MQLIFFIAACMVLWICDQNSVDDNTPMPLLLLSRARTASRLSLFPALSHQQVHWGCPRSWEGTQLGQLTPTDQRDIPYHMTSCSAIKVTRKERGEDVQSYGAHFPKWRLYMTKPCFPTSCCTSACQWDVLSQLLILLHLHTQLLFYLLNCQPMSCSCFCPSNLSPVLHRGVSERLGGGSAASWAQPTQDDTRDSHFPNSTHKQAERGIIGGHRRAKGPCFYTL